MTFKGLSERVAGLLEVRAINQFYGTTYRPEDLDEWEEAEVAQARAIAEAG